MFHPSACSGLDLFYHLILAIYLVLFLVLHANQIRSAALTMADMMNPQTPPRKLFKPSTKTKTPTPVKKQLPPTPTRSSTQSHDIFTPTDGQSRATDSPNPPSVDGPETSKQPAGQAKDMAGQPQESPDTSTREGSEPPSMTDALTSPSEIAKYFSDKGVPEMSSFISALSSKAEQNPTSTASNGIDSGNATGNATGDGADAASQATSRPASRAPEPIKELPRDDALVISPNERTKEILGTAENTTPSEDLKNPDQDILRDLPGGAPDAPNPADVSKEAEGSTNSGGDQAAGANPLNNTGEPDTTNISKDAQVGVSQEKRQVNGSAPAAKDAAKQNADSAAPDDTSDDTQVADNMGNPAHIQRSIEIPLPRPQKVVSSPSGPDKPDMRNISTELPSTDDLPGTEGLRKTEDLRNTDDLPNLDDDVLQDPPEEVLDPSVHNPSSNITPIPKIPKISPIGLTPPPDLASLAHGLGGHTVDDVGNIVDPSGEVLGHATGDLPAMVGRQVADNGEVHGEDGEVVGYVLENFLEPPSPTEIPEKVLGGLKVDHEGNILDTNGNIIGRFNEKAGENGDLGPFMNRKKAGSPRTGGKPEEKKPKVNAQTGGSPSDLFLDVKSTTDGIQLTIRIPTTFGRQQQD
ncbi:hypothetical protein GGR52DRAFT_495738 [Hypoxylon sp. FL1284]|nr:hypothetical protein GGR52DRAFT_495738 [Hypoxylon sp. FL1284]